MTIFPIRGGFSNNFIPRRKKPHQGFPMRLIELKSRIMS